EVPISYHGRSYEEGKKIGWKDGISAIYRILKYWLIDDCYDEKYGKAMLRDMARSHHHNRWIASAIRPYLGDRIIEVNAGIGSVTKYLPKRERLTVTESSEENLELLGESYRDNDLVDVARFSPDTDSPAGTDLENCYDTAVCISYLESIEDDRAALRNIAGLLVPGGRLVLKVPLHPGLYGEYDRALGYLRRYSAPQLKALLEEAGFAVEKSMNFNSIAILGWWLNSSVLRRKSVSKLQLKFFDMMVPLFAFLEQYLPLPGISLICIARKKG
ncbi:MAG: class I SAM-dependent methyltransferase, partial [Planctomycetes bacterium]|nr:class I SAM-dependent methyltransferase [Planctomycetota bacterium]